MGQQKALERMNPLRVVVVDDHPIFLAGVVSVLAADGRFDVVGQFFSAEDALNRIDALRPDCVLTDIGMKKMSGVDLIQRLSERDWFPTVTVLTVEEDTEILLRALKAGAKGYVLKGVPGRELCDIFFRVSTGEAYVTPTLAAELLSEFSRPKSPEGIESLTARERQVLGLLSEGKTNREIGLALDLAEKTIKHYVTTILQKLHLRSRTEAALMMAKVSARQT